jgi:hypothetical protein
MSFNEETDWSLLEFEKEKRDWKGGFNSRRGCAASFPSRNKISLDLNNGAPAPSKEIQ